MNSDELLASAASGDKASVELLVNENRKFIESEVHRITSKFDFGMARCEEMVQEGYIAFLGAINGFDPLKGSKFQTYAGVCIRNAVLDYIRAECETIEYRTRAISLYEAGKSDEGEELSLENCVAYEHESLSEYTCTPEEVYIFNEMLDEVDTALEKVDERHRTYLKYRFGFTDYIEHTIAECAFHFRQRSEHLAKKIEEEGLRKMKEEYFRKIKRR